MKEKRGMTRARRLKMDESENNRKSTTPTRMEERD